MKLDFETEGKVVVSMIDYIKTMLDEAPDDMDGEAATPAAKHLFEVNDNNPVKLTKAESGIVSSFGSKAIISMQTCPTGYPNCSCVFMYPCQGP
jgi:hypothetical protein